MGRSLSTIPSSNTLLNMPLGAYADVFKEGVNYKVVGSVIKRSSYPEFSVDYPAVVTDDFYVASAATGPTSNSKIAYGNNVFVTVNGESASTVSDVSSDNGTTWRTGTLPASQSWKGLTFSNGFFIAVGTTSSAVAATSTDGITWTQRTLPVAQNWQTCAGNGAGVVVALGVVTGQETGTVGARSVDNGATWTQITVPNAGWNNIIYANGVWVATSGYNAGASTIAATSPDGITWTQRTLPNSVVWEGLAYGNGVFVVVSSTAGTSTIAATSPDGITWTARILPVGSAWRGVTFGNGIFLTVANTTVAATSTDGITWTQRTLPNSGNHFDVDYSTDGGYFVTVSNSTARNILYVSIDGDNNFIYLTGTAGKFIRVR